MSELQTLLARAAELRGARQPALLATVVHTEGSTYRRPGARLLLDESGWRAGTVSGGCLEADLLETAWTRLAEYDHRPLLISYDTRRDGDILWGSGTGCGGAVEVLLERLPDEDTPGSVNTLAFLQRCLTQRRAAVVGTVIRSDHADLPVGTHFCCAEDENEDDATLFDAQRDANLKSEIRCLVRTALVEKCSSWKTLRPENDAAKGRAVELFIEYVPPPPALVIFGTGHDVIPVVRLARALGWHVTVAGRRGTLGGAKELATLADAFIAQSDARVGPDTLALVMTHNYLADFGLLETLLPLRPRYLGLLGPAARRERLLRDLEGAGNPVRRWAQNAPLHAPAGLDIGAETPEEIALAIVAEMQAVLAGRVGGALRESRQPIHALAADGENAPAHRLAAS